MKNAEETLKTLSLMHAPTGQEDEVADFLEKRFEKCGFSVERDVLGNVIARKGKGKRVLVAAHMDEISLAVRTITEKGFLKFVKVGGIYDPSLTNAHVMVHAKERREGIIGTKAPHQMTDEEMKKVQEAKDLYVDVGASSKKDAEKMGIRPGTHITFMGDFWRLAQNWVVGKAFDDRVGCTVLVGLAEEYAESQPPVELCLVGTVREESGLFGAGTATFALEPDFALAVDVTHAFGAPGESEEDVPVSLGKGPALAVLEGSGHGLISPTKLIDWIEAEAKKASITLQMDVHEKGATDASRMQYSRKGVLAASIGVPLRYMHSHSEVVDLRDITQTVKFTKHLIEAFRKKA